MDRPVTCNAGQRDNVRKAEKQVFERGNREVDWLSNKDHDVTGMRVQECLR